MFGVDAGIIYIYIYQRLRPIPLGLGRVVCVPVGVLFEVFWSPSWGFRLHVGGLGGLSGIHFGSCWGLGGQEATGKGSGRTWVGPGVAGDPDLGPTWPPLEAIRSQLGANMSPR